MTQHLARPFRALRPAPARAEDVVAPPYDVVSTDEARALATGRPYSFLHISRPEIDLPAGTSPYADETYARGAASLARLVSEGVLVRDAEPCYYVYRMQMAGRTQTGIAVAASVAAYEADAIKRHELTRPDKENDRVRNIDTLNAQTGPVLLAYRGDAVLRELLRSATLTAPLFKVAGPNDTVHTVWKVSAPEKVSELTAALDARGALYIADGHHRSAAAMRVAQERREEARAEAIAVSLGSALAHPAGASREYFLAVAFPHDEMKILDYNRVVRDLNGLAVDALLARVREAFDVEQVEGQAKPQRPRTFGMFVAGRWHRLSIKDALVPHNDPVASLDVSLLQDNLLAPILGVGDPRTDKRIDFVGGVRGLDELERRVAGGDAAVAFALHATSMEQLMAVADAGKLMPPKSTWFEPKLADGLLTHVLD
jgi:uncharacterized protein (DUF1015 family)